MNGSILILCAALALVALVPGNATAHAGYVSSTPKPDSIFPYNTTPTSVSITLSEAVESGAGTIHVTNATGNRFDVPPVTLSGAGRTMSVGVNRTGSGIITVTWTAVSAVDGHFTAGSFAWCVQNPDRNGTGCSGAGLGATSSGAPVSPFEVGLRFIAFFGLAAALGASVLGAAGLAAAFTSRAVLIRTGLTGTFSYAVPEAVLLVVGTPTILSTTSIPSTTVPKTA